MMLFIKASWALAYGWTMLNTRLNLEI